MSGDPIADAIRAVLHAAPTDRGVLRPGECHHCGIADGAVVALVHTSGDRVDGHPDCGAPDGYRPEVVS